MVLVASKCAMSSNALMTSRIATRLFAAKIEKPQAHDKGFCERTHIFCELRRKTGKRNKEVYACKAHKKIASPPSRRVFTTEGKANHSGISSPDRRRLRNSVPESFAIFSPFSLADLSDM